MAGKGRKVPDRITELEDRVRELEADRALYLAENAALKQQILEFESQWEKLNRDANATNDNISVSLASIPEYLRNGDYYRSLVGSECAIDFDTHDDNDQVDGTSRKHTSCDSRDQDTNKNEALIIVPRKCFKTNTAIDTIVDLLAVLESMRYWLVRHIPDSVISFALYAETSQVFSYTAEAFWTDMPQLRFLHNLAKKRADGESKQIIYALEGNAPREVLQYLLRPSNVSAAKLTTDVAVTVARLGLLECLKYIIDHDLCESIDSDVCAEAAAGGHLDCLKYAHEQDCPWAVETCKIAACKGHLDCLKYAHEQNCPWDQGTCEQAACKGHLDCLRYAHEQNCPWDEETCKTAAYKGHLDCLRYAHEQDCPWDQGTCKAAAYKGHLDCLKYAHEQGCPWDEETYAYAAYKGHLDCLKYAHEQGCPWDEETCKYAAYNGNLDCLTYAHEQGCPWDSKTCSTAAYHGHLDCLKYAHGQGCSIDGQTCINASSQGHLECLEFAQTNICS